MLNNMCISGGSFWCDIDAFSHHSCTQYNFSFLTQYFEVIHLTKHIPLYAHIIVCVCFGLDKLCQIFSSRSCLTAARLIKMHAHALVFPLSSCDKKREKNVNLCIQTVFDHLYFVYSNIFLGEIYSDVMFFVQNF